MGRKGNSRRSLGRGKELFVTLMKMGKKKAAWENVNKEFCKFSSGSDGSGIEDEEELEEIYHEIEDRELMFKSDHEFSCESENDEDWVEIKHARTGAAKKVRMKRKAKRKKLSLNLHLRKGVKRKSLKRKEILKNQRMMMNLLRCLYQRKMEKSLKVRR